MLIRYVNKKDEEVPFNWNHYMIKDQEKAEKFEKGCKKVFEERAESDRNARIHQRKHGNDWKKIFVGKGIER